MSAPELEGGSPTLAESSTDALVTDVVAQRARLWSHRGAHGAGAPVGLAGLAVGAVLFLAFPRLDAVAGTPCAALFRAVGVVVALGGLSAFVPGSLVERVRLRLRDERSYDFGWSWSAYAGPFVASLALLALALGLCLELPRAWPAWLVVALSGVNCFVGGIVLRASSRPDYASLPMVDLLRSDHDSVLDAGCGAGRTTLELSKVLGRGTVVALDRFDASYIDGGGRALLEHNLRIAGLVERVHVVRGDLTSLSFADRSFDSAVSAHVVDHLPDKRAGLAELHRVLKPGGRLLLVVWVPSWATFALANVLCLALTSKAKWRMMAWSVGLSVRDEGMINGNWFALLERPCGAAA